MTVKDAGRQALRQAGALGLFGSVNDPYSNQLELPVLEVVPQVVHDETMSASRLFREGKITYEELTRRLNSL